MSETQSKERGAVTLACSSVKELDEEIEKYRAKRSPSHDSTVLRNAVAHSIDHSVSDAADEYNIDGGTITALLEWLDRAAQRQLPEQY